MFIFFILLGCVHQQGFVHLGRLFSKQLLTFQVSIYACLIFILLTHQYIKTILGQFILSTENKILEFQMIKIEEEVPLKETNEYLSKFPRFSLIQKIQPKFFVTSSEASRKVAQEIRDAIKAKNQLGKTFVLGLATGSTPLRVYKQLISMCQKGQLSFKNVVTFNLDEYYPISNDNPEGYNFYMHHNLFKYLDIPKENINIPNGQIQRSEVTSFCQNYENKIASYGGIDLQILGIGRTGHIGFNQPPSPQKSITRLVYLHRLTRKDAAPSFGGIQNVPKCAITMGIETISKAKKIIIMAWSQSKSYIVKKCIQGEKSSQIPSTFLHNHPNSTFYLDKAAGQQLSRFNIPWTIKGDIQDPKVPNSLYWITKIIIWLSQTVKKPILRLSFQDYEDYGLSPLVMDCANGKVQDLNLFCYKKIISKITGWPIGNRPGLHEINENEIAKTVVKAERVLIFSPHPDDDVISMGGTLKRLKDQGHHVSVAYMTSGSNGVKNHEAQKYLFFMKDFLKKHYFHLSKEQNSSVNVSFLQKLLDDAENNLLHEENNSDTIKEIKTFIRSSQAKISVHSLGVQPNNTYCLNLPFYSKKSQRKQPFEEDFSRLRDLLKLTEPTVIYAAGDLTDPHGTHRKCLQIILHVFDQECKKIKEDPSYVSLFPTPQKIFFYRGAWQEWQIPVSRVIVPMSPIQVEQKISAILKHQSQKDHPMFPGDDKRQFWLRSKERNRNTAELLKSLGFPEYEAAECFVDLNDLKNYDEL